MSMELSEEDANLDRVVQQSLLDSAQMWPRNRPHGS